MLTDEFMIYPHVFMLGKPPPTSLALLLLAYLLNFLSENTGNFYFSFWGGKYNRTKVNVHHLSSYFAPHTYHNHDIVPHPKYPLIPCQGKIYAASRHPLSPCASGGRFPLFCTKYCFCELTWFLIWYFCGMPWSFLPLDMVTQPMDELYHEVTLGDLMTIMKITASRRSTRMIL